MSCLSTILGVCTHTLKPSLGTEHITSSFSIVIWRHKDSPDYSKLHAEYQHDRQKKKSQNVKKAYLIDFLGKKINYFKLSLNDLALKVFCTLLEKHRGDSKDCNKEWKQEVSCFIKDQTFGSDRNY